MKILHTFAMASLTALTLGATAIATLSPANAQANRGRDFVADARPLGFAGAPYVVQPAPVASTNFGYPNWPYGNGTYRGVFDMPGFGPDRY